MTKPVIGAELNVSDHRHLMIAFSRDCFKITVKTFETDPEEYGEDGDEDGKEWHTLKEDKTLKWINVSCQVYQWLLDAPLFGISHQDSIVAKRASKQQEVEEQEYVPDSTLSLDPPTRTSFTLCSQTKPVPKSAVKQKFDGVWLPAPKRRRVN
ncbi:hypothetical protein BDV93DRAFT_514470 [Ceratobasidium sp. AG-I]|nr:hypothetical protein BDV93DRAFT_514470 [Ceratobasidium sp. AG-I]